MPQKSESQGKGKVPGFLVNQEGSATWVQPKGNPDYQVNVSTPGAPFNSEPSLKWKCEDVGVEMDSFVDMLAQNRSDMEMAGELGISREVVQRLKEEFYKRGINSVIPQD